MPRGIGFPGNNEAKYSRQINFSHQRILSVSSTTHHFIVKVTRNFWVDTMQVIYIPCWVKRHTSLQCRGDREFSGGHYASDIHPCWVKRHTLPHDLPKVAQTKYSQSSTCSLMETMSKFYFSKVWDYYSSYHIKQKLIIVWDTSNLTLHSHCSKN